MLAEFGPGDFALIACRAHFLLKPGVRHDKVRQQLVDGGMAFDGRLRQTLALGGALLAQMLLYLLAVFDLGEMDRRLFVTVIAFQWRFSPVNNMPLRLMVFRHFPTVNEEQEIA